METRNIINVEDCSFSVYLGKVPPDGWIFIKEKEQWLSTRKYPKLAKLSQKSANGKKFRVPARKEYLCE